MSEKNTSASQSETEEPKARARDKEQKNARAAARDGRESKPVRKDVKAASTSGNKKPGGFRNWRIVRFTRESYHELRYKVTWPTFPEARNMALVVIVLSTVVGIVLGVVDQGLFQLFKLVAGK
jgi:preprotein translocase subunit SecE